MKPRHRLRLILSTVALSAAVGTSAWAADGGVAGEMLTVNNLWIGLIAGVIVIYSVLAIDRMSRRSSQASTSVSTA